MNPGLKTTRTVMVLVLAILITVMVVRIRNNDTLERIPGERTAASVVYSGEDLENLNIAIGAIDQRSLDGPLQDHVYACNASNMGVSLDRPWVDEDGIIYFDQKPVVPGEATWNSEIVITDGATDRIVYGNGLPDHTTGEYPVPADSDVYVYDRNPNSIAAQSVRYEIPQEPTIAALPTCLPMGTIGVATTGAVFFNPLDAELRDAVANEIFDECEGHPQQQGAYHYHHGSPCFEQGDDDEHSPLVGYALDGFGIYGPRDSDGFIVTNDDLDECHGHEETFTDVDGNIVSEYHYHTNEEFPYVLGCFKGEVDSSILQAGPTMGTGNPAGAAGVIPGPASGGSLTPPPAYLTPAERIKIQTHRPLRALPFGLPFNRRSSNRWY